MSSTEKLLERAAAVQTPTYKAPPIVADHGQNEQLVDTNGNTYLDFAGGMGVNILGHCHPEVVGAITQQAGRLCHTANGLHHATYINLCSKLTELCFGEQVFLCSSGTEAIEAALKLARRVAHDNGHPRRKYVAAMGGFHGRTMGALSITGQASYREGYEPLIGEVQFVPFDDPAALAAQVDKDTAAVVLEPIQGNGGVIVPHPDYLQKVRAICDKHGALMILDEVQTGLGRTGAWFAHTHDGVVPDIMCLAKALGGGLPLGAMVTTRALGQALQPGTHGTTFGGNPVACAAGLATIDVIARHQLLPRAERLGVSFREALAALCPKHGSVVAVRGRGMLVGIQLAEPVVPVLQALRKRGMLGTAAGSHVLRLFPPVNVREGALDKAVGMIADTLGEIT